MNPHRHAARSILITLALAVALQGCSTLKPVPLPAQGQTSPETPFKPQDELVITLASGAVVNLKVHATDAQGITGLKNGESAASVLPWASIQSVQRREADTWRTAGLIAAVVAGVALLVAVVQAIGIAKLNNAQ